MLSLNPFCNPVNGSEQTMQNKLLQRRSFARLGPYLDDVKLIIHRIGNSEQGQVHRLCAPTLFASECMASDGIEITSVPHEIVLKKDIEYALCAYIEEVKYSIAYL